MSHKFDRECQIQAEENEMRDAMEGDAMTQRNEPKCPTCGSGTRNVRGLRFDIPEQSHMVNQCDDDWHREPAAPPEGETMRAPDPSLKKKFRQEKGAFDPDKRPAVVASPAMSADHKPLFVVAQRWREKYGTTSDFWTHHDVARFAEIHAAALTAARDDAEGRYLAAYTELTKVQAERDYWKAKAEHNG